MWLRGRASRCGVGARWRGRVCALSAACVLALPARAAAQEKVPATECCLELLIPVGARTVGMGQAVTARPGADAPFVNPAALVDVTRTQLIFHRSTAADAKMNTFELLIHSRVRGNFALSYTALEFPSETATNTGGEPTGTLDIFKQALIGSFATSIAGGWSAGVNYRLFHSGLTCSGDCGDAAKSGTTHMIDAGVRYTPAWIRHLVLGAALLQAGFPLQINNAAQADVTPARLRVGAAYDVSRLLTRDTTIAVWINADAVQRIRDPGAPALNAGLEVVLDNTIFLRAGHAAEAGGITNGGSGVGLGIKYQRFDVNVAKTVSTSTLFEDPVYVSFGIAF